MPEITLEIEFTRRVETSESGEIKVDVPQSVIDSEGIFDWVERKYEEDPEFSKKVNSVVNVQDESEEVEWDYIEDTDDES